MIRFAWLQSRTQTMVAIAGLALMAITLALTGPNIAHLYDTIIVPCGASNDCSRTTISAFLEHHKDIRIGLDILAAVLPGIIGVFWGAPLVARELETGTYRLAWTQSVSRTRWMAIKLGVTLLTSVAVVGLLSLMVTSWAHPFDLVQMNAYGRFDQRDIAPIGYAAFGFVLGVATGVLIRRTVPAMAAFVVVFTAARLAITRWVRPRLMNPVHQVLALDPTAVGFGRTNSGPSTLQVGPPDIPNAWIYSVRIVDDAGKALTPEIVASTCPQLGSLAPPPDAGPDVRVQVPTDVKSALDDCVSAIATKYHEVVTFQPGNRYWRFQWYELGIYLGAAAILAAVCVWAVRKRLS